MTAGGPERRSMMFEAIEARRDLVEEIERGETGTRVTMKLPVASLVFRIAEETFKKLARHEQQLQMSVRGKYLVAELIPSERKRREIYVAFYTAVAGALPGHAGEVLSMPGLSEDLAREMPELVESIEGLQAGLLTDEELKLLHFKLAAYYESLKDKSDLPHWSLAIQSGI